MTEYINRQVEHINNQVEYIIESGSTAYAYFGINDIHINCALTDKILDKEDIFKKVDGETVVIGDIHGYLSSLIKVAREAKKLLKSGKNIVFLGDYIDRGPNPVEC